VSQKVSIERINLRIGKKDIPLTLDEARDLKDALEDLFGHVTYYPTYPVYPYTWHYHGPYWASTYSTSGTVNGNSTLTLCSTTGGTAGCTTTAEV
jgi:hypothetical protein